MEEKPNYFAIIPATVRYDNTLRDKAKLLYGEITSLSNKDGYCYASNKYFADLYDVSTTTISTLISELVDKGYIENEIIYKEGTKEILNRYLKIFKEGYLKNFKDNNTSNNNKNTNRKKYIKKDFIPPTLEEVEEYCKSRNSNVNPKNFYEFFDKGNWIDSKGQPVINWKQKLITWESYQPKKTEEKPTWFSETQDNHFTKEEEQEFQDILGGFK
jgi:hypothetical protein